MSEFSIIQQYFNRPCQETDLGIGDDAALISVPQGYQLAISTDMLVSGTHFFPDTAANHIGWKAMAVNISDMAAMGAEAKWATLSIALPEANPAWLNQFSAGLFACAEQFGVSVIGGDTTRGPLNISLQIMGIIPRDQALTRHGAQLGDEIWHSGYLGHAAQALKYLQSNQSCPANLLSALHRPQPRIQLGIALRTIAHSAIDISDGLLADLGHILEASALGAEIAWPNIAHQLKAPTEDNYAMVLSGGDDYELCFTAPPSAHEQIVAIGQTLGLPLSCIGHTCQPPGIRVLDAQQQAITLQGKGYDHFKN